MLYFKNSNKITHWTWQFVHLPNITLLFTGRIFLFSFHIFPNTQTSICVSWSWAIQKAWEKANHFFSFILRTTEKLNRSAHRCRIVIEEKDEIFCVRRIWRKPLNFLSFSNSHILWKNSSEFVRCSWLDFANCFHFSPVHL